MTRDEVIKLAIDAGLIPDWERMTNKNVGNLERFAAVVAAAEREACAKVCEEIGQVYVDEGASTLGQVIHFAAAIRARGEQ